MPLPQNLAQCMASGDTRTEVQYAKRYKAAVAESVNPISSPSLRIHPSSSQGGVFGR